MIKVCHISSAHNTYDTRILLKECCALARHGYAVSLVVPGEKDEVFQHVNIRVIHKYPGRLKRMTLTVFSALRKALATKSKIYHLHDPELFFVGVFLKCIGKKVIFDVHENISEQIKTKEWLPMNKVVAKIFRFVDFLNAKLFYLILAEDSYRSVYEKFRPKMEVVLNLPDFGALKDFELEDRSELQNELLYVGSVTFDRGIDKVIEALLLLKRRQIDFTFHCIGPMEESVYAKIRALKDFNLVEDDILFYGVLKLSEAYEISKKCVLGLSILKPVENYKYSYSTKIFEYMAVRLPLITSDFELYKQVVEKYDCGYCINPLDSNALAEAMIHLLENRDLANQMGARGLKAVREHFNWKLEEEKLIAFYTQIK